MASFQVIVTLAVAALSILSSCSAAPVDVVVIGAGIAGLAASTDLAKRGYSVVLVEGKTRTGGRMWSYDLKGGVGAVELGAGWIQGITNNPVKRLVDEYKIATAASPQDATRYGPDGKAQSEEAAAAAFEQFVNFIGSMASNPAAAALGYSIGDGAAAYIKANGLDAAQQASLKNTINSNLELEFAASAANLSAVGTQRDDASGTGGGDVVVVPGYSKLIAELEKAARSAGVQVVLGATVTKVQYNNTGVLVAATTSSGPLTFTAGAAIYTLPLGVLKATARTMFSPALPDAKLGAISRLGMGLLDKLVLVFDKAFWADTPWHSVVPAAGGSTKWGNFFSMQKVANMPVLIALNAGADAQELTPLSDAELAQQALAQLRKLYGAAVTEPKEVVRTRWAADPYTLGSYSYVRIGSTKEDRKLLAAPVGKTLFFAGEATSSTDPATTHGAYKSGLDAAAALDAAVA